MNKVEDRKPETILVKSKGWFGVYVDKNLMNEYHSVSEEDITKYNPNYKVYCANDEWMKDQGYFPSRFEKVVLQGEFWK